MPVATATNVKGKVTATNAKCEVRTINEGDPIEEGEVVKTGEGGSIDLKLMMGGVVSIEAKQTVTLDGEFLSTIVPDARDNALSIGGDDFNNIIEAIRKGTSLDSLLEETVAGFGDSGGSVSSDGGSGFVMLAGVVEAISPFPADVVDYSLNRGSAVTSNAFAAAQAVAAIQAAAHAASVHAAAQAATDAQVATDAQAVADTQTVTDAQAAAANTVVADTSAPVITLDPSAGVNAPITGTVSDTGGTVSSVQVTVTNTETGAASAMAVPVLASGAFTAPAPTGTGIYTVTVTAIDSAGNVSTVGGSGANIVVVDTTASASIAVNTVAGDDIVNAAEARGDVAVTGSVGGDAKANDTVTLTVGNNQYTGTVATDGTYSISVPGAVLAANTNIGASVTATDVNGNTVTVASHRGYTADITAPTVTISTNDSVLTTGEVAHLSFVLSEASNNFAVNDITVTGGTLANFAGSGTSYTADFIPTPNSNAPATVAVASGSFADAMGNPNEFESTLNMSVNTVGVGETLRGGPGEDTLVGGAGSDTLYGGPSRDNLDGGAGNDTLYGEQSRDTLKGGLGNDLLYGGESKDVFAWSLADRGAVGNPAVDTIADFEHIDRIDLQDLLVGAVGGENNVGNLLSYINVSKEGDDTVLRISSQGGFDNGEYHPDKEDQRIVIENVDLTVQTGTDIDQTKTLLNMLKNDNLNVNGN